MESASRVRILDESVCVSVRANTIEKDINLSPSFGKIFGQVGSLALIKQPYSGKEGSEFKPAVLYFKIYHVSDPFCGEGLVCFGFMVYQPL